MKAHRNIYGGLALCACLFVLVACNGSGSDNIDLSPQSSAYTLHFLVTDGTPDSVTAPHTDGNLVNPWGIAFNPNGTFWVADNKPSVATLYDGNGVPQTLIVSIPPNNNRADASPTGIVFNGTGEFVVTQGTTSASGLFIFAGEAGTISAWAPTVDATHAIKMYDDGAGAAVYKGLAIGRKGNGNFLYATDFNNNKIDTFDKGFAKTTTTGGFVDPNLPAGFSPFGIQNIQGVLFVTYAKKQNAGDTDETAGPGLGLVDLFDTDGHLIRRVVTAGPLNAPWGIALAPPDFGDFSGDLLVGNFGDGKINAFNPVTGQFVGNLKDGNNQPIQIDGLWGIAFGNGLKDQPTNSLFFAAGTNDEADGAFGRVDP